MRRTLLLLLSTPVPSRRSATPKRKEPEGSSIAPSASSLGPRGSPHCRSVQPGDMIAPAPAPPPRSPGQGPARRPLHFRTTGIAQLSGKQGVPHAGGRAGFSGHWGGGMSGKPGNGPGREKRGFPDNWGSGCPENPSRRRADIRVRGCQQGATIRQTQPSAACRGAAGRGPAVGAGHTDVGPGRRRATSRFTRLGAAAPQNSPVPQPLHARQEPAY